MPSEKKTGTAVLMLLGCFVTGCGGGGSGGASATVAAPSISQPITQAQAKTVAASSDSDMSFVIEDVQSTIPSLYWDAFTQFQAGSNTNSCPSGGTSVVTVHDSGAAGFPDAGDSVSITYHDCWQINPYKLNGTVTLTWASASGDPNQSPRSHTAVFTVNYQDYETQNFQVPSSASKSRAVLDGQAAVTLSATSYVSVSVAYNNLTRTGYLDSNIDPNQPDWVFYDKIGLNQMTASYTAPQPQGTGAMSDGSFVMNGKLTYQNSQGISTESTYATISPIVMNTQDGHTGGVLGISLQNARQSLTKENAVLAAFSLDAPTDFRLGFPAAGSVSLTADGNHDGVFESAYVFKELDL